MRHVLKITSFVLDFFIIRIICDLIDVEIIIFGEENSVLPFFFQTSLTLQELFLH